MKISNIAILVCVCTAVYVVSKRVTMWIMLKIDRHFQ